MNGRLVSQDRICYLPSFFSNSLLAKSPAVSAFFWLCLICEYIFTFEYDDGTYDVDARLVAGVLNALVEPIRLLAALLAALVELGVVAALHVVVVPVVGHGVRVRVRLAEWLCREENVRV